MVVDKFTKEQFELIDMHGHLGVWFNMSQVYPSDEALMGCARQVGIDRMVCSHTLALVGEMQRGNAITAEFAGQYEQIKGYIAVNPHYLEESMQELTERFDNCNFVGIKLHPETHRYRIITDECKPIFTFAEQKRCPVLIHVMDEIGIEDCKNVAEQYPNVPFIMGHSGGFQLRVLAVKTCKHLPNVYFDLTSSTMLEGNLEWMVDEVGASRVLFGTDIPFLDPKHCVGQVLYSHLTTAQKREIFSGNAKKILEGIKK